MRTIEEVRGRLIGHVAGLVATPSMFGRSAEGVENLALGLLGDLCFIDEREADSDATRHLHMTYGPTGVSGRFGQIFAPDALGGRTRSYGRLTNEVASVFAREFHRLGYIELPRLLTDAEWTAIREGLCDYVEGDYRRSAVIARHGIPSLTVGNDVLCYAAGSSPRDWIYFDCDEPLPAAGYPPSLGIQERRGWPRDPLLRDIRVPARSFADSLILTTWGKVARWGPDWIDNPEHQAGDHNASAPTQLHFIEPGEH
jgi:hypothetical protein